MHIEQVIKSSHPLVVEDKIGAVGWDRGVDTLHLVGHGWIRELTIHYTRLKRLVGN